MAGRSAAIALVIGLLASGCRAPVTPGDDGALGCLAKHPPVPESVAGREDAQAAARTCVENVRCTHEQCRGAPDRRVCELARLLSAEAATCIARASGLEAEVQILAPELAYNIAHRRIVWNVRNLSYDRGTPGVVHEGGAMFVIDAVDGRVLDRLGWQMLS
jgi:hypothetical protein